MIIRKNNSVLLLIFLFVQTLFDPYWSFRTFLQLPKISNQWRIPKTKHYISKLEQVKLERENRKNPPPDDPRSGRPYVIRQLRWTDRKKLSEFPVGSKHRGKVISVRRYGMYVDIGARTDGLVHINAVSNSYFIDTLEGKYIGGDEVDVWVSEVDQRTNKLLLQMYPCSPKDGNETKIVREPFKLEKYKVGDPIKARVVRFSDYGAYCDIGAPFLAFLHRHKMKSNRKQRKLQSWEIVSLNAEIDAYVYRIDPILKRIEITNYTPDLWNWRFARPNEKTTREEEKEKRSHEYVYGDVPKERKRQLIAALEKKHPLLVKNPSLSSLTANMNDKDDIDQDPGFIRLNKLTPEQAIQRTKRVLIDDFDPIQANQNILDEIAAKSVESRHSGKKYETTEDFLRERREVQALKDPKLYREWIERKRIQFEEERRGPSSPLDIYKLLSRDTEFLTLSRLKKWFYIDFYLKNGLLPIDDLRILFRQAGGLTGRLSSRQFLVFHKLYANYLEMRRQEVLRKEAKANKTAIGNDGDHNENDDDEEYYFHEEYEDEKVPFEKLSPIMQQLELEERAARKRKREMEYCTKHNITVPEGYFEGNCSDPNFSLNISALLPPLKVRRERYKEEPRLLKQFNQGFLPAAFQTKPQEQTPEEDDISADIQRFARTYDDFFQKKKDNETTTIAKEKKIIENFSVTSSISDAEERQNKVEQFKLLQQHIFQAQQEEKDKEDEEYEENHEKKEKKEIKVSSSSVEMKKEKKGKIVDPTTFAGKKPVETISEIAPSSSPLGGEYVVENEEDDGTMATDAFNQLRKGRPVIKWKDILNWPLIATMMYERVVKEKELEELFTEITQFSKTMNEEQFQEFFQQLKLIDFKFQRKQLIKKQLEETKLREELEKQKNLEKSLKKLIKKKLLPEEKKHSFLANDDGDDDYDEDVENKGKKDTKKIRTKDFDRLAGPVFEKLEHEGIIPRSMNQFNKDFEDDEDDEDDMEEDDLYDDDLQNLEDDNDDDEDDEGTRKHLRSLRKKLQRNGNMGDFLGDIRRGVLEAEADDEEDDRLNDDKRTTPRSRRKPKDQSEDDEDEEEEEDGDGYEVDDGSDADYEEDGYGGEEDSLLQEDDEKFLDEFYTDETDNDDGEESSGIEGVGSEEDYPEDKIKGYKNPKNKQPRLRKKKGKDGSRPRSQENPFVRLQRAQKNRKNRPKSNRRRRSDPSYQPSYAPTTAPTFAPPTMAPHHYQKGKDQKDRQKNHPGGHYREEKLFVPQKNHKQQQQQEQQKEKEKNKDKQSHENDREKNKSERIIDNSTYIPPLPDIPVTNPRIFEFSDSPLAKQYSLAVKLGEPDPELLEAGEKLRKYLEDHRNISSLVAPNRNETNEIDMDNNNKKEKEEENADDDEPKKSKKQIELENDEDFKKLSTEEKQEILRKSKSIEEFLVKAQSIGVIFSDEDRARDQARFQSIFQSFSHGRPFLRAHDLMEWEVVRDLIGLGYLTKDSLEARFKEMARGRPGIDIHMFDSLFNDLIGMLYQPPSRPDRPANLDKEGTSLLLPNKQGKFVPQNVVLPDPFRGPESAAADVDSDGYYDDEEEYEDEGDRQATEANDEDGYNLNVDDVFDELTQGRKVYLTREEIENWEIIQQLIQKKLLSEIDLNRTFESIQTTIKDQYTADDFAILLKEIFFLCGFEVEADEINPETALAMEKEEYERAQYELKQSTNSHGRSSPSSYSTSKEARTAERIPGGGGGTMMPPGSVQEEENMLAEIAEKNPVEDLFGTYLLEQEPDDPRFVEAFARHKEKLSKIDLERDLI